MVVVQRYVRGVFSFGKKKKVMIDAGHGGTKDPGAVFEDRMEKDDTLRLALAVGRILEENGVNVVYTRSTDVYARPTRKQRWEMRRARTILFPCTAMRRVSREKVRAS